VNVSKIIKEIRASEGATGKAETLKKYKDDETLQWVLKMTYTKQITFGVRPETLDTLEDPSPIAVSFEETPIHPQSLLEKLASRELAGNKAREAIKYALDDTVAEDQFVLLGILGRNLKIDMKAKSINKVMGKNFIPETPYMGAKSYNKKAVEKIFAKHDYAYSEIKMDGRYMNMIVEPDSVYLESRQGLEMGQNFRDHFAMNGVLESGGIVFNGELTIPGTSRYESNGIIASYVANPETPILHNVVFTVWDSLPLSAYREGVYDLQRTTRLHDTGFLLKCIDSPLLQVIEWEAVSSAEEAHAHYVSAVSRGEEGTILKTPTGIWKAGKPAWQIKFKPVELFDLRIVGYNYGKAGTKNEKVISSVNVESSDGLVKARAQGLKEAMMQHITDNQDSLMGTIVEVKGIQLSSDSDGNYSIMSPYFVALRDDKASAHSLEECQAIHEANVSLNTGGK
jgi:DNA ligase-1